MCGTCGCGEDDHITYTVPEQSGHHHGDHGDHHHHHHHESKNRHEAKELQLEIDVLSKNNLKAEHNRGYFEALNIFAFNLVSSPGSGKTSLLERTINELKSELDFFIIEGDQQTSNDADRIHKTGAPVVQINTGNGCHLDALMVNTAAKQLKPSPGSVLFIENVGNLVCPSLFDLGENARIVIISTTEGDDKPIKYPTMFQTAQLCIINKIDLLPYVDFDVEKAKNYALRVNRNLEFITLSVSSGEGLNIWYKWLKEKIIGK